MNVTGSIVARRGIGSVPFCGIWSGQTVLDRFCNRLGSTPAQYEWISSFSHLHNREVHSELARNHHTPMNFEVSRKPSYCAMKVPKRSAPRSSKSCEIQDCFRTTNREGIIHLLILR